MARSKGSHNPLGISKLPSKEEALKQIRCENCEGTGLVHDRELGWKTCIKCKGSKK
jgi:hypothetical protein